MYRDEFSFNPFEFKALELIASNFPRVLKQAKEIPIASVFDKIFVTPPYCAFKKVFSVNDVMIAPIEKEQALSFESTTMTSAESSRHLAILGSYAIAATEPDRKHYIAHKARKRIGTPPSATNNTSQLYVLAMPLWKGKKEAAACTLLINAEGEIIFRFKVGYQIMTQRLFHRVFHEHLSPTEVTADNPYESIPKITDIAIDGNTLRASLPIIKKESCAGHFDNIPMLPIGTFAYMAINALGDLLKAVTEKENDFSANTLYHLVSAEMDVFLPTPLNDRCTLEITYHGINNDHHFFSWLTLDRNKQVINQMNISFEATYQLISTQQWKYYESIENELLRYKSMSAALEKDTALLSN